jgi:hypothetical protein
MLKSFINEIIWEIPKLTERKVYRIFCSMKARQKKYWTFWLGKRDGFRFWVSERQMQYFVNLMINYWFLSIDSEVKSSRGFKCRVFKASKQLLNYFIQIKDYVATKFEYIDPVAYVKARFIIKKVWSKLKFKVHWDRYIIHLRWRFKNVIYDVGNNCIINPLSLW